MKFGRILVCIAALLASIPVVLAQNSQSTPGAKPNVIESLAVSKTGGNTVLKISLREALTAAPANFVIANPARIVFDFPSTENGLGYNNKTINEGGLRSFSLVQAGDRSRLVLNLDKISRFEARQEAKFLLITLLDEGTVGGGLPLCSIFRLAAGTRQTACVTFNFAETRMARVLCSLTCHQAMSA
ncbi:MAG: AMIN domain-containing protein [Gammaproteobacteria bacterium]|nr:AMIN domain-containing protein [Gammaproteobacteria bacterium]